MSDSCPACRGCKISWNAGRNCSCHDFCEPFLKWERKKKPERERELRKPVHIPGGY